MSLKPDTEPSTNRKTKKDIKYERKKKKKIQ